MDYKEVAIEELFYAYEKRHKKSLSESDKKKLTKFIKNKSTVKNMSSLPRKELLLYRNMLDVELEMTASNKGKRLYVTL